MKILSPITRKSNVKILQFLHKNIIIDLYKKELDIDVIRFFKDIDNIQICQCNDTGYLFYYPFTILGDELFYDELKVQMPAKFNSPYYPVWKWEFEICLSLINKKDKVYEIGCGTGNFLAKLKESGVKEVYGTELNHDSVSSAISKGLKVISITVEDIAKQVSEEYDVVCAFQVLEHIADVKSFLDASLKILKKEGRLMIAVPFNNPYLFTNDKYNTLNMPPHHMGLWNKKVFQNLGKFFPIELIDIIIEKLPNSGYDFEQFYKVNKDKFYPISFPFKPILDNLYFRWLKKNHYKKDGKNIIAIFKKNS